MKKRKILMGVLLSTLAASAISCGKKEETETPKQEEKPEEKFILEDLSDESSIKLDYNVGEFVNVSDVVLKAIYTSSLTGHHSSKVVTDFTITAKDSQGNVVTRFDSVGKYTVTVAFEGKTKDFEVNVTKKEFDKVSDAITYANTKDSFVNAGTASTKTVYSLNTEDENAYSSTEKMSFKFGNEFIEITTGEGDYTGQLIYSLDKEGDVFAVQVSGSGADKTVQKYGYDVDKKEIGGIAVDIFGDGVTDGYGAADTLKALYNHAKKFGFDLSEKIEEVEGKKVYSFSFKSLEEQYGTKYGYAISAEFTLGLFGNVENAKLTETKYYDPVVSGEGDKFTLPENPDGVVKTYEISQTTGNRLTDNEYLYSHLAVESFKVMDGTTEIKDGDVINIDLDNGNTNNENGKRQVYNFTISDYSPSTANPNVDEVIVSLKGTAYDGTAIEQSSDGWNWDFNYVNVQSNGTITFYAAGNYTVTFSSASVTKTITINVTPETPSEIGIKTYENLNDTSEFIDSKGSYEMYQSNTLYLLSSIAPKLDQACVVSLPDGTTGAALVEETVKGVKAYKFTATSAGTYTVTFAAMENSEVTNSITITVLENPNVAEMLAGTYYAQIGSDVATVVFSDGRVTVTKGEQSQNFAVRYENGEIVLTDPQGDSLNYDIIVSSKYELKLVDTDDNEYTLSTTMPVISEFELAGEYSVSLMNGMITYTFAFVATDATTGTLAVNDGGSPATYSYVYNQSTGVITLTKTGDMDVIGTNRVYVSNDVLYYEFGSNSYACTKTSGGSTGDNNIEIAEKFIATWTNGTLEFTITAETKEFTIGKATYTITACTDTLLSCYVNGDTGSKVTFMIMGGQFTDGNSITFDKKTEESQDLTVSSELIGSWVTTQGGAKIEIMSNTLIEYFPGERYTYTLTSANSSTYVFEDGSYSYTITYSEGKLSVLHSTAIDTMEYTKVTEDDSNTIPEGFIGTWVNEENDYTIEITADSITYLGNLVTSYSVSNGNIVISGGKGGNITLELLNATTISDGSYNFVK